MSQNGRKMAKLMHNAAKKFDWVNFEGFAIDWTISRRNKLKIVINGRKYKKIIHFTVQ